MFTTNSIWRPVESTLALSAGTGQLASSALEATRYPSPGTSHSCEVDYTDEYLATIAAPTSNQSTSHLKGR